MTAAMGVLSAKAKDVKQPNILWITSEDNNVTWLGCYGNKDARTPNIDKLAHEGFRYTQCYSNGAVCSATRSSWITGMHSPSLGNYHHRSSVSIPASIPLYPEELKAAGYYAANFGKTDYNLPETDRVKNMWSQFSGNWDKTGWLHWKDHLDHWTTQKEKPFFQVINLHESHESELFHAKLKPGRTPLGSIDDCTGFKRDPNSFKLYPYHPDIAGVRATYARYYEAISEMDTELGKILKRLDEAGLTEETIVIYNSDHGGALPRGKRFLFNSGTHCPLIIRIPEKYKHLWPAKAPDTTIDRLVSFQDMPKTWISLAGRTPPKIMSGRIFLGPQQEAESPWHFSYRGRNDARDEFARSIRDKRYLYIQNYYPFVPRGQYMEYQWKILAQTEWEAAYKAGLCDAITGRHFNPRDPKELYDTQTDPHCLNNLIGHPEQQERIKVMKAELKNHAKRVRDSGFIPESELEKRAKDNQITLYETAQNPALYQLDAYLEIADLAISGDPKNLPEFIKSLHDKDSGVRYWAAMGCMILGNTSAPAKSPLKEALNDESHEVRIMAAWALIKLGEKEIGYTCIQNMMIEKSYAVLKIMNVIDWMGEDGKPLIKFLETQPEPKGESRRIARYLPKKYT